MSEGRARLLELIDQNGSISDSARELGMSYRHAWGILKKMNEASGSDVVETHRGGRDGGGSVLTSEGRALLDTYNSLKREHQGTVYRKPSLTVDGILVEGEKILLIVRKNDPFRGRYALPGGFVDYGETVEEAMVREMKEETGLDCVVESLLGVYSDPDRDPRGHTVSTVFTLKRIGGELAASTDALEAGFFTLGNLPKLAFDHVKIVRDFLDLAGDQAVTDIGPL